METHRRSREMTAHLLTVPEKNTHSYNSLRKWGLRIFWFYYPLAVSP